MSDNSSYSMSVAVVDRRIEGAGARAVEGTEGSADVIERGCESVDGVVVGWRAEDPVSVEEGESRVAGAVPGGGIERVVGGG